MSSLIDDLRAMAQAIHDNSTTELTVLGAGGRLAVRYRPPAREKLDDVLSAYMFGRAMSADEEVQLLVDCCDTVLRADPATGETKPYDDQGALRFDDSDPRWAQMAEVFSEITERKLPAPKSARDCVRLLFRLDAQPMAAAGHAQTLVPWLQGIRAEIAARVEGKSPADGARETPPAGSSSTATEPAA